MYKKIIHIHMMANKETNKKYGDWIHERNLGSGGFGIVQFWKNCRTGNKIGSFILCISLYNRYINFLKVIFQYLRLIN